MAGYNTVSKEEGEAWPLDEIWPLLRLHLVLKCMISFATRTDLFRDVSLM